MPSITPFIPGGAWRTATFGIGPILISWGAFLGKLINFIIIAFVVFIIAQKFLKEEKVEKNNQEIYGALNLLTQSNSIACCGWELLNN
jgi:large-conductance mechanosensitive channel